MTSPDVTPFPGVYRRKDSRLWQFRLRTPKDLLPKLDGKKWAKNCSLETADLREANDKARALQAEWAERFRALRKDKPQPVDLHALRVHFLADLERRLPEYDQRTAALSGPRRTEMARTLAGQVEELRDALREGYVLDWADEALSRWGYARTKAADAEALPYLLLRYELFHESAADETRTFPIRVKRLGEKRELLAATAPAPTATAQAASTTMMQQAAKMSSGPRMRDAFDAWRAANPSLPAKTVKTFKRHVAMFEAMSGDPPLSTIRKVHGVEFRDKLTAWAVDNGKTASTADNVLLSVRALAEVAVQREWIEGRNPFEKLSVTAGGKESEGREPWTQDELRTLFDAPLFRRYELPSEESALGRKGGADAAYWVPLILAYTGARPSEVCQLWVDDVSEEAGSLVIEFRENNDRDQSLKNRSSWRAVPVHSELIRLGFRDYWQEVRRKCADGPLFPALQRAGQNGAAGQFGQWFGKFKLGQGFSSRTKTLHSFRHTAITELTFAGTDPAMRRAITGHAEEDTHGKVYSATIRRKASQLRATLEALKYPSLTLPRVFRAGQQDDSPDPLAGISEEQARERPS